MNLSKSQTKKFLFNILVNNLLMKSKEMTIDYAKNYVEEIVKQETVTAFKIGKTGRIVNDKFKSSPEYTDNYDEILEICHSPKNDIISEWEKRLIAYFLANDAFNGKCNNHRPDPSIELESPDGYYRLYLLIKN